MTTARVFSPRGCQQEVITKQLRARIISLIMHHRVDNVQREIVSALRAVGALVQHLHDVGRGVPDLLVAFRGRLYLLELKSRRGRVTPHQRAWLDAWCAVAPDAIHVVRDVDEALRAIGAAEVRD